MPARDPFEKADVRHTHSAGDLTTGVIADARLPGDLARTADVTALQDRATALEAADVALDARLDVLEADTGWITWTPATGYESKSGILGYRRRNGEVFMRGLVGPTSGAFSAGTTAILGNLPSGFRPVQAEWFGVGTNTNQPAATIVMLSNGDVQLRVPNVGLSYVGLASVRFLTN